jgi:hypothetical protein
VSNDSILSTLSFLADFFFRSFPVMSFIASFALFGAAGNAVTMPNWSLNPTGNYDYCKRLTAAS